MAGTEVIWTLKHAGYEYSIPGRATSTTYELSDDGAAFGSLLPAIRFEMDGMESTDHEGIIAERLSTSVGKPLTLSAFAQDRSNRDAYPENNEFFIIKSEQSGYFIKDQQLQIFLRLSLQVRNV